MINWILFDQNGVQTKDTFAHESSYSINGKTFDAKLLESIYDLPEYSLFDIGKFSEQDLVSLFLKSSGIHLSYDEFLDLFKQNVKPIECIENLLIDLKSNGYKLASVINEGKSWADYKLDESNFRHYFDLNIISGDIGLRKPSIDFYNKTIELIGASPEECIFIDDSKKNCDAAFSFGMYAIHFKDSKQLKNDLISLGIKF